LSNLLVKTSGQEFTTDGSVKTLMLLHGWGMNSQVWEPIREALESRYHLLWVDLPGHGFNKHVEAISVENMLALVAKVIPRETHIMAWSLGGLIAQMLTKKLPQHIKSLSLVTTTLKFSQGENDDWLNAMSDEVLNRFADNLKQDTEKTLKGFIALQFIGVKNAKQIQDDLINQILYQVPCRGNNSEKWGGAFLDNVFTQNKELQSNLPTQEALDVGLEILKHSDLRELAPTCPEHWIFSEYDRLIPKEVINDLKYLRPDAEITLLEKAGHAPFITHSEAFLKNATRFIDALD